MLFRLGNNQTGVATIAMINILSNSLSFPAQLASTAVVDVLSRRIVEELTLCTVVGRKLCLASRLDTLVGDRLHRSTEQANDLLGCEAVHSMIGVHSIVTESARDPLTAAFCSQLAVSRIVFAAEQLLSGRRVADFGVGEMYATVRLVKLRTKRVHYGSEGD